MEERTINRIELDGGDVSPVTYPAYPQTDVGVRQWVDSQPAEFRQRLTDALGKQAEPVAPAEPIDESDDAKQAEAVRESENRERQLQLAEAKTKYLQ